MLQAKFSLTEGLADFLDQHRDLGFPDKSAVVREALERMREQMERQRLEESAGLYAEVYEGDEELRELTDQALGDWPE